MAAKVEADSEQHNTIDPERLKKEVARIEDAIEAKLSHKMKYVESCKPLNERVANAYEIASKAAGVPMKVLKATIKQRELQRKIEGIPEKLEDESRETFDMVCQALGAFGDTPLGAAAKARAAGADARGAETAAETVKRPRGRPRKAPNPDAAAPPAEASEAAPEAPTEDAEEPFGDESDTEPFRAGYGARMSGVGCAIPEKYEGDDGKRWHNGWRTADERLADQRAADENAERLRAGISPLH